jgi:hypothetical protein
MRRTLVPIAAILLAQSAHAALITDPNDPRNWQGATVGTFAALFYGADTLANRQQVVNNQLLDDGIFNPAGFTAAPLIQCVACITSNPAQSGRSLDTDGTLADPYAYVFPGPANRATAASNIDQDWIQTGNLIGGAVWDLGPNASTAVIFNTIDHGPLPQEAIESTVYLSNAVAGPWTEAATKRVWLEGYLANLDVLWDGFVYAVGTTSGENFRYASITWGGPGALLNDGDNEINGVMGATGTFTPPNGAPEPGTLALFAAALLAACFRRRVG